MTALEVNGAHRPPLAERRREAANFGGGLQIAGWHAQARQDIGRLMTLAGMVGPSWEPWRAVALGMLGGPLGGVDLTLWRQVTGRETQPPSLAEAWICAGRRSAKTRMAGVFTVLLATLVDWPSLAPGEAAIAALIASDRRQARVAKAYVSGLFQSSPALSALVKAETAWAIELVNGITIEILTSDFRSLRGHSLICCVADEFAYWPDGELIENSGAEILAALRPALATTQGLLLVLSSPYRADSELGRVVERYYGIEHPEIVVVRGGTKTFNPTIDQRVIDAAYARDPARAASEWDAIFRSDLSTFLSYDQVRSCIDVGRAEHLPRAGVRYVAFTDPSGGIKDSFTVAIGHIEKDSGTDYVVIDVCREWTAPLDPAVTVREIAALVRAYGCKQIVGDAYSGAWVASAFMKFGVTYMRSERTRSALYLDSLSLVTSQRLELPDSERLISQMCRLERSTTRLGKDRVDHGPSGRDDVVNAVLGCAAVLATEPRSAIAGCLW